MTACFFFVARFAAVGWLDPAFLLDLDRRTKNIHEPPRAKILKTPTAGSLALNGRQSKPHRAPKTPRHPAPSGFVAPWIRIDLDFSSFLLSRIGAVDYIFCLARAVCSNQTKGHCQPSLRPEERANVCTSRPHGSRRLDRRAQGERAAFSFVRQPGPDEYGSDQAEQYPALDRPSPLFQCAQQLTNIQSLWAEEPIDGGSRAGAFLRAPPILVQTKGRRREKKESCLRSGVR